MAIVRNRRFRTAAKSLRFLPIIEAMAAEEAAAAGASPSPPHGDGPAASCVPVRRLTAAPAQRAQGLGVVRSDPCRLSRRRVQYESLTKTWPRIACIDNSAGLLPIEFSEVTITRTLFRAGDSEYQINGAPCRLLDIQELLSDSRHRPSAARDRRAGPARRGAQLAARGPARRRRGSRRHPEVPQATRAAPSGGSRPPRATSCASTTCCARCAASSRRCSGRPTPRAVTAGLVEELHAIRIHLAGHEIAGLQAKGERLRDQGADLDQRERGRAVAPARPRRVGARRRTGAHRRRSRRPRRRADAHRGVARTGVGLRRAARREDARRLHASWRSVADEGVFETLVADAAELRRQLDELGRSAPGLAGGARRARARASTTSPRPNARSPRARSPTRNADDLRMARRDLEDAARGARAHRRRARRGPQPASSRARHARRRRSPPNTRSSRRRTGASSRVAARAPSGRRGRTRAARARRRGARRRPTTPLRSADADAARWQARAETLAAALDARPATDAAAAALDDVPGVVGPLVDHLDIDAGCEAAVPRCSATPCARSWSTVPVAARQAFERLAAGDSGALAGRRRRRRFRGAPAPAACPVPACSPTACAARCPASPPRSSACSTAPSSPTATGRAPSISCSREPSLTVVTARGDRFGGRGRGASAATRWPRTRAALDDAQHARRGADEARGSPRETLDAAARGARRPRAATKPRAADAERRAVHELDGIERGPRRGPRPSARSARSSSPRSRPSRRRCRRSARPTSSGIAALEVRVPALEAEAAEAQSLFESRALVQLELDERATDRRRPAPRPGACAPRSSPNGAGARAPARRGRRPPRPRPRAPGRSRAAPGRARASAGWATRRVGGRLDELTDRIDECSAAWRTARQAEAERAAAASGQLEELRTTRASAEQELLEVRERQQRREVDEAETRLRLETAVERAAHRLRRRARRSRSTRPRPRCPTAPRSPGARATSTASCASWARSTRSRSRSTTRCRSGTSSSQDQLEDVKASRRELHARDQGRRPGDRHRLRRRRSPTCSRTSPTCSPRCSPAVRAGCVLTDPDDLLNTGIEMEARPSGKNVRRLSLLSGGERSLTALAFLFAVFRARPSPFYLMDEVEAALDDVNLHRFLDLVHEFRDEAQLRDRVAPEAHDGGGRLPLRRVDAAGRLEPGREPAHARRRCRWPDRHDDAAMRWLPRSCSRAAADDPGSSTRAARRASSRGCARPSTASPATRNAADIADALSKPIRIVVILLVGVDRWCGSRGVADPRFVKHTERRRREAARRCGRCRSSTPARCRRRAARSGPRRSARCCAASSPILDLVDRGAHRSSTMLGDEPRAAASPAPGIAGVALGFGAQSLVRDFLSGIFMLIEDQFGVGDVIDTGRRRPAPSRA